MKVLITGANGFLGSHLVKHFLSRGNEIMAVSLHTDRLTSILDRIQFSGCNMNAITSIESSIATFSPDVVIHCAWSGGNNYLSTQSSEQFYKNLPGLADLMEILKRRKIPHFVGIGSGAEYGDKSHLITETTPETPNNLYGVCKLMAKQYTEQYCINKGIKWTWIRPFYTYGPDDVNTRLIPSTIQKCLDKLDVPLNECATLVDYLYIDDFVSAVDAAINFVSSYPNRLFNVCSGEQYIVRKIVSRIGELTDNFDKLQFGAIPERTNQPCIILGSSQKLKLFTKWEPKVSLEEGLQKTIEFYKKI